MPETSTAPATTTPSPARRVRPTLERRTLAIGLATGVFCAVAIAGHAPGVGVTLAALVVTTAAVLGRRGTSATPSAGPWRWTTATIAVVLAVIPTVSDAGWVVGWAAVAAWLLVAAGSTSATRWRGLGRGILATVPGAVRAAGSLGRSLVRLLPAGGQHGSVGRTVVVTLVVLTLFGSLFASADELFGSLLQRYLVPDLDLPTLAEQVLWFGAGSTVVVTLILARPGPVDDRYPPPPTRYLHGIEWKVPLGGLVALFASFVVVQFRVLFGGHDQVLDTAGLTYAGYARAGFAQLLVVAGLTLAVVGLASRFAAVTSSSDRRLRRVLLAALCVLTLVVLASALDRLHVYEDAFGYTRARLAAQAIAWTLAALFALVLVTGASRRTRWLPRATLVLGGVAVLAFAAVQPDAIVAQGNVDRFERTGELDLTYVSGLSTDAVPALTELPANLRGCILGGAGGRLEHDRAQGWQATNLSRARAASLLADHPSTCVPDAHGLTWPPPSRY